MDEMTLWAGALTVTPDGSVVVSEDGACPLFDEVYRFALLRLRAAGVAFPESIARAQARQFFEERISRLRAERDAFERRA